MPTIAIIGGGGAFGIHTALYLLQAMGCRIIGIGRSPLRNYLSSLIRDTDYQYYPCHLVHEYDRLHDILEQEKPSIIINFAAQAEATHSFKHSWRFFATNLVALSRLVEDLELKPWLERFIHISTTEMYGHLNYPAKEDEPIKPQTPYGVSKVTFDLYLKALAERTQFPAYILRIANLYGPGQPFYKLIPKLILSGLLGQKMQIEQANHPKKSYLYITDLAHAILLLIQKQPKGILFNVGPSQMTSNLEIANHVAKALHIKRGHLCGFIGQQKATGYWINSEALSYAIGWQPKITWQEGISHLVEWTKTHLLEVKNLPRTYLARD